MKLRANRFENKQGRIEVPALVMAGMMFSAVSAQAIMVDFGDYRSGAIIDSEYATGGADNTNSGLAGGYGFTVKVVGDNAPNIGVLYDTRLSGGEDPDLYGGTSGKAFQGGNLDGTPQGNMLVIQERASSAEISNGKLTYASGQSTRSTKNAPDDNAGGGTIEFTFEQGLVEFGFDWIDLDSAEDVSITFIDTLTGNSADIGFAMFTDSNSDFFLSDVKLGDHTSNRISGLSVDSINNSSQVSWSGGSAGPATFDQVVFSLNGSGGVSVVNFTPVPEISTVVGGLSMIGFVGCGLVRRRRLDLGRREAAVEA